MQADSTRHTPPRHFRARLLRVSLILIIGALLGWGLGSGALGGLWDAVTSRQKTEQSETPHDPNHVRVDKDGLKHAPQPVREFRNASCGTQPHGRHIPPSAHWGIPEIGQESRILPSGRGGTPITLPAAPASILYMDAQMPGSTRGQVILAGHVDYDDGRLSPWGHLHKVQPCTEIYISEPVAGTHVYRVTDLYTLPQQELLTSEVFGRGQAKKLFMVTCSGPSVGDNGAPFQFRYSHNLIVRAEHVGYIRERTPSAPENSSPAPTTHGARGGKPSGMGS